MLDRLDSAVTIHQDMINDASNRLKQFCEKTRALGEDVEKKEERAVKEAEILKSLTTALREEEAAVSGVRVAVEEEAKKEEDVRRQDNERDELVKAERQLKEELARV